MSFRFIVSSSSWRSCCRTRSDHEIDSLLRLFRPLRRASLRCGALRVGELIIGTGGARKRVEVNFWWDGKTVKHVFNSQDKNEHCLIANLQPLFTSIWYSNVIYDKRCCIRTFNPSADDNEHGKSRALLRLQLWPWADLVGVGIVYQESRITYESHHSAGNARNRPRLMLKSKIVLNCNYFDRRL